MSRTTSCPTRRQNLIEEVVKQILNRSTRITMRKMFPERMMRKGRCQSLLVRKRGSVLQLKSGEQLEAFGFGLKSNQLSIPDIRIIGWGLVRTGLMRVLLQLFALGSPSSHEGSTSTEIGTLGQRIQTFIFFHLNTLSNSYCMEEPQKQSHYLKSKDLPGFQDDEEETDFKLSSETRSDVQSHSTSKLEQKPLHGFTAVQPLPDGFLSQIVHSNLTSVFDKSQKEYQKQVFSKQSSNISELPNSSNISSNGSQTKPEGFPIKQPILLSTDVLQSDLNHTSVKTSEDNLIFPRQYTRTFKLKPNADPSICFQKFSHFVQENDFQIRNSTKQLLWARKVFSHSVFKLIFHFCCGVASNVADFQLNLNKNSTIQLKLVGEASSQSQKMMVKMEVALWKSAQLELSEDQNLRYFLESQSSDELKGQLKYIMQTEQSQNGLQLCVFSCLQHISQLMEKFKLKSATGSLSTEGILTLEKQIFLSSQLFPIFKQQFRKQELKLTSKKCQILHEMTISQCFDYLEVDPIYRLEHSINRRIVPYSEAMRVLERLNYYITPQQKLQCFSLYYETIQQCCKEYHGGRVLLQTMDHILPILIYTLAYTKVNHLYANVKLVEVFVRQINTCEPQLKMIANLYASIEYIANCWNTH